MLLDDLLSASALIGDLRLSGGVEKDAFRESARASLERRGLGIED